MLYMNVKRNQHVGEYHKLFVTLLIKEATEIEYLLITQL